MRGWYYLCAAGEAGEGGGAGAPAQVVGELPGSLHWTPAPATLVSASAPTQADIFIKQNLGATIWSILILNWSHHLVSILILNCQLTVLFGLCKMILFTANLDNNWWSLLLHFHSVT